MKKILIPIDFSETATNAVRYAVDLAESLLEPAELVLLHVCPEVKTAETVAASEEAQYKRQEAEEEALSKLQAFARAHCRHSGIHNCLTMVTTGKLTKAIVNAVEMSQAELIIMGTRGGFGSGTFLASTNTSQLTGVAPCPVLAVPDVTIYRPILKIVFAADLSLATIPDLQQTVKLAQTLNCQLQVVHVSENKNEPGKQEKINQFWEEVQWQIRFPWIDFITVEANDITEGLEQFVLAQEADMLVVCPKKRSLFNLMLNGSTTRQILIDALLPTLVLPHHEEEREEAEESEEVLFA